MLRKSVNLLVKGVVAVVLGLMGVGAAMWLILPIVTRPVVDTGGRPLIVIATEGGDRDYSLSVYSRVDVDGDYTFSFLATVPHEEGHGDDRFWIDYSLTVFGSGIDGDLRCDGGSTVVPSTELDLLATGPAAAYEIDRWSDGSSATHRLREIRDATPTPLPTVTGDDALSPTTAPSPQYTPEPLDGAIEIVEISGRLATWLDTDSTSRRFTSAGEASSDVYVQECTISADLVWRAAGDGVPTAQSDATLLAPQFNFTSIGGKSDHQGEFSAWLDVERSPGSTLVDSYPDPDVTFRSWSLSYDVGSTSPANVDRLDYTEQPTLVFANKTAVRDEQNRTLLGGFTGSLALALLVRGVSDLLDSRVERRTEASASSAASAEEAEREE